MKKIMFVLGLTALAVTMASSTPAMEGAVMVDLSPLTRSFSPPPLGRKQGWLAISNRDWHSYSLRAEDDKLFLHRGGGGFGGMVIPSGATVTFVLEKDTYDLYGSNSDRLRVRVREGRTTTVSLEPFGYAGNTGLTGVVNDGDRIRNGTLFDSSAPAVIVQRPPIVVSPPPPPVIIHRPPFRPAPPPPPPPRRPGYGPGRRPGGPGRRPPPPPHSRPRDDRGNGWSIIFDFGKH